MSEKKKFFSKDSVFNLIVVTFIQSIILTLLISSINFMQETFNTLAITSIVLSILLLSFFLFLYHFYSTSSIRCNSHVIRSMEALTFDNDMDKTKSKNKIETSFYNTAYRNFLIGLILLFLGIAVLSYIKYEISKEISKNKNTVEKGNIIEAMQNSLLLNNIHSEISIGKSRMEYLVNKIDSLVIVNDSLSKFIKANFTNFK